jgi:hypothetical protein
MARPDTVYSLFGLKTPQEVAAENLRINTDILRSADTGFGRAGAGIGIGLRRLFGGADPEMQRAQALEEISREYQPGNLQNMAETYTRLKEAGAPAETLQRLSADITARSGEFNEQAQAKRAQSAAVAYVSRVDPDLGALVAANPAAAGKAIETVNKRLDTKVVGDSLLQLNPQTKQFDVVYAKPAKPGDQFRLLTAKEKTDRDLPTDIPFQLNTTTNQVAALANIPRQSDATAPTGYRYVYGVNESGQSIPIKAEPIPGTPQAAQLQAEQERANKRLASSGKVYNVVSDNINDAMKLLDDPDAWVAGKRGAVVELLGKASGGVLFAGTAQQTLIGKLDTIKANIGFGALQNMRENSPTGGALGNVSNFEVNRLEATINKLDATADPEVLKDNLREVEEQFQRTARSVANDLTDEQLRMEGLEHFIPFRTATRNPDGTYTPLPVATPEDTFDISVLPEDIQAGWDTLDEKTRTMLMEAHK